MGYRKGGTGNTVRARLCTCSSRKGCAEADDHDTARLHFDAAGLVFTRLGATPDLAALARLTGSDAGAGQGLAARESEVLMLVAGEH